MDSDFDRVNRHEAILLSRILVSVVGDVVMSVKDPFCGFPLNAKETNFKTVFLAKQYFFDSEYCMQNFVHGAKVAYFSMEIGVDSNVPTTAAD